MSRPPRTRKSHRWCLPVLLAGLAVSAAHGQCDAVKHVASDGAPNGRFGVAVDIGGAHAVVGGRVPDGKGEFAGVAYLFARGTGGRWEENERIALPVVSAVLAIDGDVFVAGDAGAENACPNDPRCDSGAVYVYVRESVSSTWRLAQRLIPDDGAAGDAFGVSVAVDGEVIVVGASETTEGGAVYVFGRSGDEDWTQRARLTGPGQVSGSGLGRLVVTDGRTIVASAPAGGVSTPDDVRRVHVFERTSITTHDWSPTAALEGSTAPTPDGFALSIALAVDTIVVGAPGADEITLNGGAAWVFRRDPGGAWSRLATLRPAAPEPQLQFGASVAAAGSVIAVSSLPLLEVGAVHTYRLGDGGVPLPLGVLRPDSAVSSDLYGFNIALDGDTLFAAALGDDEVAPGAGAVYAFEIDRCVSCPGDLDRDGAVGLEDLLTLIARWGACPSAPCFSDTDGDGDTGFADLLELIASWGPCAG